MRQIRPFQSAYCVIAAENTNLDGWHGARDFARSNDFSNYLTTKSEYEEYGGEYFREHYASNKYFPTPAPIAVPTPETSVSIDDKGMDRPAKMDEDIYIE